MATNCFAPLYDTHDYFKKNFNLNHNKILVKSRNYNGRRQSSVCQRERRNS
ncbi:agip67 [Agrotis ipsilon multiple nucleopolyhedrovirus]|uniref:Uncharacterized protein n=1 Tax=Agrotis ipsilon multiple nucleopolyhedrovirus TaxID=208013 RepID=B6D5Y1_9ABAC|nr:agip67 [Agrotis ipsilon multiple nucleopolyhedrovirus]ACI28769.1 unknown [Agrotis ipsilon multiple nucleopolyhedrovirus]